MALLAQAEPSPRNFTLLYRFHCTEVVQSASGDWIFFRL